MSNTETKNTCDCEICKKTIPLDTSIACQFCNSETDCVFTLGLPTKEPHLFCKRCTGTCFKCEEIGCDKCVDVVCCDCAVTMCNKCRNGDNLCGCYGACYHCDTDLNRGRNGWPCNECEKWYCHYCGLNNNSCKECGPESYSDNDDSNDDVVVDNVVTDVVVDDKVSN